MDDAGAMRALERRRDLDCGLERLINQRAPREPVGQGLAIEVLHDEKRRALVLAHVVQGADMRMRELRDRTGFAIEPLTELRIGGEHVWEDLDSDRTVESRVARFIHFPHATRAQQRQNLVCAEARAGG